MLKLIQNISVYLDKPSWIRQAFKFILVNIAAKIQKLRPMSVLVEGHFAEQDFTSWEHYIKVFMGFQLMLDETTGFYFELPTQLRGIPFWLAGSQMQLAVIFVPNLSFTWEYVSHSIPSVEFLPRWNQCLTCIWESLVYFSSQQVVGWSGNQCKYRWVDGDGGTIWRAEPVNYH